MRGIVFHGTGDVRCENIDDAQIADDHDILVQTKLCGICGSDLHVYHNEASDIGIGGGKDTFCIGHEAVGEVVEVGKGVVDLAVGDQVMLAAMTGCGACRWCLLGESKRCKRGFKVYGFGGELGGCQAEAIRVPAGDFNAARIPDGVSNEQAILLTDNLATAYGALLGAEVRAGKSVAVVGLGPIGLMAVELALVMGASVAYAIDPVAERKAWAEKLGAIPVDGTDVAEQIREATQGLMVDCVIEAVGRDAAMTTAISLVGVQGFVSALGVNTSMDFRIPFKAFAEGVTIRGNFITEVHKFWPALVPMLQQKRIRPEQFITERVSLDKGPEAYAKFDRREGGTLKALLLP
ncbi:alcohol dehydrogenase catalytic domain-containing protein [Sphingomonas sp. ID0503]|uniref:alcohol dehydrogenase catalytic domain-containing protein n=1 Tax=Sphingomonas sp. ID0503 TaxID=3399691 RepID=UPI003AFA55D9